MELIARNFFEVMAECEWLLQSRDRRVGTGFVFSQKNVTGKASQKNSKEKPHVEAILRHWYLPKNFSC